jgi:O-antigen/teichoic acid export membrane protein
MGVAYSSAMVASVLAARMMGKSVFGELGMINSTVGMLGEFAGLGLGLTTVKHVAEWRISDPKRAGRIVGMSMLVRWSQAG